MRQMRRDSGVRIATSKKPWPPEIGERKTFYLSTIVIFFFKKIRSSGKGCRKTTTTTAATTNNENNGRKKNSTAYIIQQTIWIQLEGYSTYRPTLPISTSTYQILSNKHPQSSSLSWKQLYIRCILLRISLKPSSFVVRLPPFVFLSKRSSNRERRIIFSIQSDYKNWWWKNCFLILRTINAIEILKNRVLHSI